MIEIDVTDELSPAIKRALEHSDAYLGKVAKGVGFWFRNKTKEAVYQGAPNGEPYKERIKYEVRKALNPKAPRTWYGKLRNAIAYEYLGSGTVALGWTSKTAVYYGHIQEYGFTRRVTSAVRRKWAQAGHPLKSSATVLDIPARPVFEPMVRQLREEIAPLVEEKVSSYIVENAKFGKTNRRKYKVHSV